MKAEHEPPPPLTKLDLRHVRRNQGEDGEYPPSTPPVDIPPRPATPHPAPASVTDRRHVGDAILRKHKHSFAVVAQQHTHYTLDMMVLYLRKETGAKTVDWGTIMGQQYFWIDTSQETGRKKDMKLIPAMVQELLDHGEEVYLTDGTRVRFPPFAIYSRRLHNIRRIDLMMHDAALGGLRSQFTDADMNPERWRYPNDVAVFIAQAVCLDVQFRNATTPRARRQVGRRANVSIHPLIDREYKLYRRIWKSGVRRPEDVPEKQLAQWIKLQNEIALKWSS